MKKFTCPLGTTLALYVGMQPMGITQLWMGSLAAVACTLSSVHAADQADLILSDVHIGTRVVPHAIVDASVTQGWIDLNREYQLRRNFDQLDQGQKRAHIENVQGFQRALMYRLRDQKISELSERAQRGIERTELKPVAQVMGLAIGAYEYSRGREFRYRFGQESSLTARTVVRDRSGSIGLNTPVVSTSVGLAAGRGRDHVTTGASRKILGVQSAVSYAWNSRSVVASMSREIYAGIVGSLQRSQAKGREAQNTVQLQYGMNF